MEVYVLNENTVNKRGLLAEHGLSLLIERDGARYLFDTGQTAVFLKNADRMGLNLDELDGVILSHGHYDHSGGLYFLAGRRKLPPVYVRREAFLDKYSAGRDGYRGIGIPWEEDEITAGIRAAVHLTGKREEIAPGVHLIGDIPLLDEVEGEPEGFFVKESAGACGAGDTEAYYRKDTMRDEQLLVIETGGGLAVFCGCAHPGIINCLEEVRRAFPGRHIHTLFAGMHLRSCSEERLAYTVSKLREYGIEQLLPAHCTGQEAIARLRRSFPESCRRVETGMRVVC